MPPIAPSTAPTMVPVEEDPALSRPPTMTGLGVTKIRGEDVGLSKGVLLLESISTVLIDGRLELGVMSSDENTVRKEVEGTNMVLVVVVGPDRRKGLTCMLTSV